MRRHQVRAQLAIDHERCARHPPCADQIIDAFRFNRSASFSRTSAPDKAQSLMREPKCAMPSPTMKRYDKSFIGMRAGRSEEHTSELQSLMRISYAGFCLKKKQTDNP